MMARLLPALAALLLTVMTLLPATTSAADPSARQAREGCPYGALCLYTGDNFQGSMAPLYSCALHDLSTEFPLWNRNVRSFINNQTPGTHADFFAMDEGGKLHYLFASIAYGATNTGTWRHYITHIALCLKPVPA